MRSRFVPLVLLIVSGCHSGSGSGASTVTPSSALRTDGAATNGGEGDGLATALLLSADYPVARAGRATMQMSDAGLRDRLIAMSTSHLHASALTVANGPGQAGSAAIRRMAADPGAPIDSSGNGSNLDETLEAHYRQLALYAGSAGFSVQRPTLFPWVDGTSEFAAATDPKSPTQRTRPGRVGYVDTEQVGQALLARVMLASGLLRERRGDLLGATPNRGMLGVILLQQAVAMEETIFGSLFLDGTVLGSMQFPTDYDPALGRRWVPRSFRVGDDASGNAATYTSSDRSSSLEALAALMRAGAELCFLGSSGNLDHDLRDVFLGLPLGRLPVPDALPTGGGNTIVTWEDGVDRLLAKRCAGCHDSKFKPEPGLFAADSYDNVHLGGRNSRQGSATPLIVRGDAENSVLYYVLLPDPPSPFVRMPNGGPWLSTEELQLVKDWIDDGARSAPPAPPRIGVDLAITMYKNLVAMHVGPGGVLFERHDGDAPVPFANPAATGAALQALAAMSHMSKHLTDYEAVLTSVAEFAAANLVGANGGVVRSFDIASGKAVGVADLFGHARLAAGLLAASRTLESATLQARAVVVARRIDSEFFDAGKSLFRSEAGLDGSRYSPRVIAAVVDALREMADAGLAGAIDFHEQFLKRMLPVLAFSELGGGGEVLGDGVPDTDGNGLREPALAGGEFGLAPLFVGAIVEGAEKTPPDSEISWSKHIQPLFRSQCGVCHMDGSTRGDGYSLDTRALAGKTINPRNPMPLIVPGDPENSFLYRKLVDGAPTFGDPMPLAKPPLAERGLELVRRWIQDGATGR